MKQNVNLRSVALLAAAYLGPYLADEQASVAAVSALSNSILANTHALFIKISDKFNVSNYLVGSTALANLSNHPLDSMRQNTLATAIIDSFQNDSDFAQKVIEIVDIINSNKETEQYLRKIYGRSRAKDLSSLYKNNRLLVLWKYIKEYWSENPWRFLTYVLLLLINPIIIIALIFFYRSTDSVLWQGVIVNLISSIVAFMVSFFSVSIIAGLQLEERERKISVDLIEKFKHEIKEQLVPIQVEMSTNRLNQYGIKTSINHIDGLLADLDNKIARIEYIDDPYNDDYNPPYHGSVYLKMAELFDQASEEVLALSVAAIGNTDFLHRDDGQYGINEKAKQVRNEFFTSLENAIEQALSNKDKDFIYNRVFQVPSAADFKEIKRFLGDRMTKHCKRVLDFQRSSEALSNGHQPGHIRVSFKTTTSHRLTGFTIIDRRIVVVLTGGIATYKSDFGSSISRPYHSGAFIIEGNSDIVNAFRSRFMYLYDTSTPVNDYLRDVL